MHIVHPSALARVGLGLRRGLLKDLQAAHSGVFDFLEVAPENWIGVGGAHGAALRELAERYPLSCHGLSLSLGGSAPLDVGFLARSPGVSRPLPRAAVQRTPELLQRRRSSLRSAAVAVHRRGGASRRRADPPVSGHSRSASGGGKCLLLRRATSGHGRGDVHQRGAARGRLRPAAGRQQRLRQFDQPRLRSAHRFLAGVEPGRVVGMHVAGHFDESDTLKIDTHGASVKPVVWALLADAYARFGAQPTLLERDFNFPVFSELVAELQTIRHLQDREIRHG